MPSLITNFTINTNAPIDDRMVASTSTDRNAISYKYDGMQVFTLDSRTMWTYNASTLSWTASTGVDGNGIYGGSGSLVGNTYVNTGTIADSISAKSYNFVLGSSASTNSIYYSTIFNRHTATGDYTGVEVKNQWSYNSNTSSVAYISFNPLDPINGYVGGIDFSTSNTRRVTIDKNGVFRLWSPTYSADIIPIINANRIYTLPNKNGTFSMISDLTSLTLQNVTSVGATTSTNVNFLGTMSVSKINTIGQVWTNIVSFGSGWGDTVVVPRYTKNAMGIVSMQGTLNAISVSWATVIFTLPVGYRPTQSLRIPCWYAYSGVYYTAYVFVGIDGTITISSFNSLGNTGQLDISPISFSTL